jgi:hypothetical protein
MRYLRNRRARVAAIITVGFVAAGAAVAAWTILANGNGAARVGTIEAPSVTRGQEVADLFPGSSPTGSIGFVVSNPNGFALTLTQVQQNGSATGVGCDGALISLPTKALSIPIPPGSTDLLIEDAVQLADSAPTSCQGASVTVPSRLTFSP